MKCSIHKLVLSSLAILAVTATSCRKSYLDVNNDPNRVTESNITPELIFPQALHATGATMASLDLRFANDWLGYWANSGSFAIDQTETTYNIDFPFGDPIWQSRYDVLFDLYQTKQKAIAEGDSVLAGASMMLSAKNFQELVDIFGNIPYSQAFQNDKYTQPAYDKATDIYANLQKTLDTAIIYMQATERSTFPAIDIAAHGDQTHWIKFANTLKLRLLIRQSEVSGFDASGEIAKIINNGGVLHAGETLAVNPGYSNQTNKQSPYYGNYGLTPTGTDANNFSRANTYIVNLLNANSDPRINRFFKAPSAGGNVTGCVYGLAAGNPDGAHSSNIGEGLAGDATQDQWIMNSFVSMFLEAEAIARGWMPGDAKTAYENAVTESFVWLGVPDAANEAAKYMNNTESANWANAGASPQEQAKFITYQKYIANVGVDPLESWADLRRLNMIPNTGYISVNPSRISNTVPVRLLYPQSEYTTNAANVRAEGTINQFTSKIFWQP